MDLRRVAAAGVVPLALLVAACGSGDPSAQPPPRPPSPRRRPPAPHAAERRHALAQDRPVGLHVEDRDDQAVYLRGSEEHQHHSLVLRKAPVAACSRLGFKVGNDGDLDKAVRAYHRGSANADDTLGVAYGDTVHRNQHGGLVAKERAGADFAITQVFFDPAAYCHLLERSRAAGVRMPADVVAFLRHRLERALANAVL